MLIGIFAFAKPLSPYLLDSFAECKGDGKSRSCSKRLRELDIFKTALYFGRATRHNLAYI